MDLCPNASLVKISELNDMSVCSGYQEHKDMLMLGKHFEVSLGEEQDKNKICGDFTFTIENYETFKNVINLVETERNGA